MNAGKWWLLKGNGKLGKLIHTWSLPAVETCPGRSSACTHCYAMQGNYTRANVRARLEANYLASLRPDFARRMVAEIQRRKVAVVRIHASGDFYSLSYADAWYTICRLCPDVRFYGYTRSWRVPEIAAELGQLAELRNVRLWYSSDDDTGFPAELPRSVRVAYLQTTPAAASGADLIFRVRGLRAAPARRIGLALVCPVESGSGKHTNCSACKLCWR